jgi:signal transduction histidine kinase/ActR/RegA family two-component response regulator
VKIRTRAFLLGLLPTLLVAVVLTAYHLNTRLDDLETTMTQRGMAMARHLASSAEYGVLSGNSAALGKLLDQALAEPGVASAVVVWPNHARLARGETIDHLPPLGQVSRWQAGARTWFAHPVQLSSLEERDLFIEDKTPPKAPLAWVAVSLDSNQQQVLAWNLLLTSLGITLTGLTLAMLLIYKLALTGVQPLLNIITTVKRISSGGFGTRMDVTAHSQELRELQSMVNQMSESLRSYQQDMEAKVRAVTAELEHKKKEAEQASLAKSRFLAAASHDLRQPMHAISLYVESLKPQMQGRSAEDTLNKIERSIQGTVELFNAILDVTKLDAGVIQPTLAPVRIRKLFLHLAEEFAGEADSKNLSLRVRAPDIWIESDEILLERIFRNLLSNALHHTTRGGVLLCARPCQGRLRLQLWDTGRGIDPEHQPRIFDEFYQGTQETQTRHGLGLGLAIVRRLARLLGYPLQLDSRPGRGTVFSLDVPILANAPAYSDESDEDSRHVLNGRVLVVDDDPAVVDALGQLLQQWGMEVDLLHNLEQVRHALQAAPDLVLADYQLLSGETGLMVAEAVHARWGAQIPVILITGDTRTETIQTLRQSGFPILHKPVRANQLRVLLTRLLQSLPASQMA